MFWMSLIRVLLLAIRAQKYFYWSLGLTTGRLVHVFSCICSGEERSISLLWWVTIFMGLLYFSVLANIGPLLTFTRLGMLENSLVILRLLHAFFMDN